MGTVRRRRRRRRVVEQHCDFESLEEQSES